MQVDLDTLVMDPTISLETFLDPRFEFIGAIDCHLQAGIQAGVYFVRNSLWTHMFLLEVFVHNGKDVPRYEELGDQALIKSLVFPYDNFAIRNHVKIVSPKWFNTYMHIVDNCPNNLSRWEEGDFLVHTTGRGPHDHDKGKHMDDYLAILEARSNKETF